MKKSKLIFCAVVPSPMAAATETENSKADTHKDQIAVAVESYRDFRINFKC